MKYAFKFVDINFRQVSAPRVWVGLERQVPVASASAPPWFRLRITIKAADDYETNFRYRRSGIHLESVGAQANLVLPSLSVVAARWRPSVRPFISVRLCLFDESVRRACRLDQLSSPYLSYFTIVHYSWDARATVEHRNVALSPPPLPPHPIRTLKEKRRQPKGGSTRTRSVRRGERASQERSKRFFFVFF